MPFPSSPHWAPMMAIAGMILLLWWSSLSRPLKTKELRHKCTGALAATRYQRMVSPGMTSVTVRHVDPLLVITNSEAGTSDEERLAEALAVLRERASVEVAATSNPGELDGVLHRAGSRHIVVAGGDGSLHAVISALHRRHELENAVVGLLPMGTGNDFARGVGIPLDIEDAARVVLDGKPRTMDLVVDEVGEIVVNSVHVGAGANASRRGQRWKDRLHSIGVGKVNLGKLGYPIGAAMTAWNPPIIRVRIEVDGEVVVDLDEPDPDGRGRQRLVGRRRRRADAGGRRRATAAST